VSVSSVCEMSVRSVSSVCEVCVCVKCVLEMCVC